MTGQTAPSGGSEQEDVAAVVRSSRSSFNHEVALAARRLLQPFLRDPATRPCSRSDWVEIGFGRMNSGHQRISWWVDRTIRTHPRSVPTLRDAAR